MTVYVGTSGWQYDDWRGPFYPEDVPKARWLEHYGTQFAVVESNNAFYRLPEHHTFRSWAERTPDDFSFTVKMSRFLTHIKRLRDPEEPVARFFERAAGLRDKLGPVLLQLPPTLRADVDVLNAALKEFPRGARAAVEFRHPTWFTDETRRVLETREAALCLADGDLGSDDVKPRRKSRPVTPLWRTAEWGYVRFHHGAARPDPCYGRGALAAWAGRLAEIYGRRAEVYVFFNNDYRACAPANARVFARFAGREGLRVTRVPQEVVPIG